MSSPLDGTHWVFDSGYVYKTAVVKWDWRTSLKNNGGIMTNKEWIKSSSSSDSNRFVPASCSFCKHFCFINEGTWYCGKNHTAIHLSGCDDYEESPTDSTITTIEI